MHCSYDGALVGPVEFNPPKRGANAIDIIFKYYASRRQLEDKNTVVAQTFEEAAAHNMTMDAPELAKFVKDFFPSVFSHREVKWMFAQVRGSLGITICHATRAHGRDSMSPQPSACVRAPAAFLRLEPLKSLGQQVQRGQ